ncbi:MAG: copper amine oxidase, partial [Selenomonadaceae bacterium]|nr:copper amine oxidase [Selenomonadaceae bacterium]
KRVYDPQKDGMVYIPIGDNERDVYKMGIDAADGSTVQNYGNYGVLYRIEIPTTGTLSTHFLLSPLGGVYAGAVRVQHRGGTRLVETPTGKLYFGEKVPFGLPEKYDEKMFFSWDFEFADLGLYPSYKGTALEYSPPGASNLPALLVLAPGEEKKEKKKEGTIVHTER